MKKCKYFEIHELVDEATFNARGEKAWQLIDSRLVETIDKLRERFGKMTINNWKWGGDRSNCGLRTNSSPYYSPYSQHSFGRAVDIIPSETTVSEIRKYLLSEDGKKEFPHIKGIELEVSWLHIDTRNSETLLAFKP